MNTGTKIRTLPDPKWPKPPVNETKSGEKRAKS